MRWISSVLLSALSALSVSALFAAALLAVSTQAAFAWQAANRHAVNPVSQSVFEVVSEPGSGPAQFWCGAGDFVRHALQGAANQRIYVWRALGPSVTRPGRRSVHFSLSAPGKIALSSGYSLSVRAIGDNLTAAAAYEYCVDDDPLFKRW